MEKFNQGRIKAIKNYDEISHFLMMSLCLIWGFSKIPWKSYDIGFNPEFRRCD